MALDKIHLRKVLQYLAMDPKKRASAIRADARAVVRNERRPKQGGGGDFHSCFWADAKAFAAGELDLSEQTEDRIVASWQRKRLYPLLQGGFLKWWKEKRRWINEEITALPETVGAPHDFVDLGGRIKVENVLALKVGDDGRRLIYPYFSETPPLTTEVARLGLWLMQQALGQYEVEDMRILDVLRGEAYSIQDNPFQGNEGLVFVERYAKMVADWRSLLAEFRAG